MQEGSSLKADLKGVLIIIALAALIFFAALAVLNIYVNPNHERNCNELKQKAFVAFQAGNLKDAEQQYRLALKEAEQSNNSLQTPAILIQLVSVYHKDKRLAEAELSGDRALTIYDKLASTASDTTDGEVRSLVAKKRLELEVLLAQICEAQGKDQKAKRLLESAIAHQKDDLDSVETGDVKQQYASLLHRLGKSNQANQIETGLASDYGTSSDVGKYIGEGIRGIYTKFAESRKNFEVAYSIAQNQNSPYWKIEALTYLALCDIASKKNAEAEVLLRKASDIVIPDRRGEERLAEALRLRAYNLHLMHKEKESDAVFDKAIHCSQTTGTSIGALQLLYALHNTRQEEAIARSMFLWLYEKHKRYLGNKEIDETNLLSSLGCEAANLGKTEEAMKYFRQYSVRKNKPTDLGWLPVENIIQIAQSLQDDDRFQEAEQYWRKARSISGTQQAHMPLITRSIAYCLVGQKKTTGREQEIISLLKESWDTLPGSDTTVSIDQFEKDVKTIQDCYKSLGRPFNRSRVLNLALNRSSKWWDAKLLDHFNKELALSYLLDNKWDAAADALKSYIESKEKQAAPADDLVEVRAQRVRALQLSGRYAEARSLAKTLLAQKYTNEKLANSQKAAVYFDLGAMDDKEGHAAQARKNYQLGRNLTNQENSCAIVGGLIPSFAGRTDLAEALCKDQIDLYRQSGLPVTLPFAVLHNVLADIYTGDKKWDEADAYYKQAFELYKPFKDTEQGKHFIEICTTHSAHSRRERLKTSDN